MRKRVHSREKLRGVLGDGVEALAHVVAEVDEGLVDVPLPGEPGRLILLLPRLDVHHGQASV